MLFAYPWLVISLAQVDILKIRQNNICTIESLRREKNMGKTNNFFSLGFGSHMSFYFDYYYSEPANLKMELFYFGNTQL